jgi:hypothetical protein
MYNIQKLIDPKFPYSTNDLAVILKNSLHFMYRYIVIQITVLFSKKIFWVI